MSEHDDLERIPTILPWERQANETTLSYSYFAHYRDLGPRRSLAKAAPALGVSVRSLEDHSMTGEWRERVAAYDDFMERRYREARETRQVQAAEREVELALALQHDVALRLRGGQIVDEQQRVTQVERISPQEMSYSEIARLARVSVLIERQALGMPTDILKASINNVSAEEYRKLARGMFEIALRHIPEERQARFAAEIEAFYDGA